MGWITLIIAGLFEVGFTFSLGKVRTATGNLTYMWYGSFILFLLISMALLMKATQSLPVGTAYAVWTGIGAVGTVLMGIFVFKDPVNFWRLFFITTLIVSLIGLKISSN